MKSFIVKAFYFFRGRSFRKYAACTILLALTFIGFGLILYYAFDDDGVKTTLSAAFGFAISNIIIYAFGLFSRMFEDRLKVNTDTKELLSVYTDDDYKKVVTLKGKERALCYHPLLENDKDGKTFIVDDDPDKHYERDGFIEQNFNSFFALHASSSKANVGETIRLDDVTQDENGAYTLHLSRSNYFNHLVTNRVVDYEIVGGLSLRSMYEPGPRLREIKDSKFSNHIGVNALVFLEDGHLLIPQRKKDSTINKNGVTASIAARLNPSKEGVISKDYLLHDCILDYLKDKLALNYQKYPRENVEVSFLGLGQNVYEGGKPQFYYSVKLKGITHQNINEYMDLSCHGKCKIDGDKVVYIARFDSLSFPKSEELLSFEAFNLKKKKYKKLSCQYERSMLANIWHYQRFIGE